MKDVREVSAGEASEESSEGNPEDSNESEYLIRDYENLDIKTLKEIKRKMKDIGPGFEIFIDGQDFGVSRIGGNSKTKFLSDAPSPTAIEDENYPESDLALYRLDGKFAPGVSKGEPLMYFDDESDLDQAIQELGSAEPGI